ncbi:hypothetical protein [Haloarcula argentinensis]|uniref:Uncharacterized protein n=1 Tax=Haloarcula argentinensis TaxID=43776 RepID=A0A830FQA2_HALAR|nr:hypothetical protein [Haloarcula argentinensis]GGM26928.1 hypothetical protein GCM10009006_05470 [Haloarcula argentinensis]
MDSNSENKLSNDDFQELLEYRVRSYENLARDSLTVLSIQLFILPIGLSIVSIIISIFVGSGTENIPQQIAEKYSSQAGKLFDALTYALGAIALSTISYYISRRQAELLPELALERSLPDQSGDSMRERTVKKISEITGISDFGSVSVNLSPEDRLIQQYNTVYGWKNAIRIILPASIVLTLISIARISEVFFGDFLPVADILTALFVSGVTLVLALTVNFLYVYIAEGAVSFSVGIFGVIVEIILHYIGQLVKKLFNELEKLLGGRTEVLGVSCVMLYFVGMFQYRQHIDAANSGVISPSAVPFLILIGLFGVLVFTFGKLVR